MLRQYSLSMKTHVTLRFTVFLLMLASNIIFAVCGLTDIYGLGGKITAVTLSSLMFTVWLMVCFIADYEMIKSLFSVPKGYLVFLTPVARWKILLARLAAILTWEIPGFVIGVIGIIAQSFILSNIRFSILFDSSNYSGQEFMIMFIFWLMFEYVILFLTIFFMVTLAKSIFFSKRARALLGIVSGILIHYIMSFLDLLLIPFATVTRFGVFIYIQITSFTSPAFYVYMVLLVIKAAILFYITSYLMERKINL